MFPKLDIGHMGIVAHLFQQLQYHFPMHKYRKELFLSDGW